MNKVISRGTILLCVFFGGWFLLQQVNWLGIFKINPLIRNEYVKKIEVKGIRQVGSTATNNIDRKELKVYLLDSEEVNAFALPNHQLMIYTGLVKKTSSPEALCGVIGHELAHIEKDHVMQSLVRELGIGTLFAIISGRSDLSMITEVGRIVSSSAFNRNMEKEADLVGLT